MNAIEVSGMSAADIKASAADRKAKAPVIAKQRATRRAKADENLHAVDRGHGPSLHQQAASAHSVDLGPEKNWQRPYALPAFPDPPGFVYCYIARHRRRHGDDAGLLSALREGWQFVRTDELDEQDLPTETFTGRLAKYGEVVGDESTVLMKLPERLKAQRDAYYNNRRDAATREVQKKKPGLEGTNTKMPLVEDINESEVARPMMRARRAAATQEA
jgi:hypothetical protein